MNEKGTRKNYWFLSLADNPNSNWGNVDVFYKNIENECNKNNGIIVIKSKVVLSGKGKGNQGNIRFLGESKNPSQGDCLAFYHSTRATGTKKLRQAQVSLIGELMENVDVDCQKNVIKSDSEFRVKVSQKNLEEFKEKPIIRQKNCQLFNQIVLGGGSIYTLYETSEDLWNSVMALPRYSSTRRLNQKQIIVFP